MNPSIRWGRGTLITGLGGVIYGALILVAAGVASSGWWIIAVGLVLAESGRLEIRRARRRAALERKIALLELQRSKARWS